jgi:Protein of unknown function (DUF1501)
MDNSLISRRALLKMSGLGIGSLAFTYLLHAESGPKLGSDILSKPVHFPAKARSVIQLVQNGGPSQMDLFDPKPELQKRSGQRYANKVEMFQPGSEANELMASPFEFHPYGRCGMQLSEALTHTPTIADDICLVRSMFSEHNNHLEALVMLQTGKIFPGRPTLGAWVSYGLGTENQNLPAYIVLRDPEGYNTSGPLLWENGWLPALFRGTEFNSQGAPVLNLHPSVPLPKGVEQDNLAFLAKLNEEHRLKYPHDSDLEARIRNYELAARMQLSADEALDLSKESEPTRKLYGLDNPNTAGYGTRCLMARRLVESGVRFVQVFPPIKPSVQPWDSHGNIYQELQAICAKTELPVAGLIKDLKSRGLLDTTIVIWAGEFGRLPVSQNSTGRDHNRNAFSLWVCGGGFKAGYVHGATDEFGYRAVENRVSVPDLHATLLQQLGLDHRKLTYQHNGREETLTDFPATGAKVVKDLLASTGPMS